MHLNFVHLLRKHPFVYCSTFFTIKIWNTTVHVSLLADIRADHWGRSYFYTICNFCKEMQKLIRDAFEANCIWVLEEISPYFFFISISGVRNHTIISCTNERYTMIVYFHRTCSFISAKLEYFDIKLKRLLWLTTYFV